MSGPLVVLRRAVLPAAVFVVVLGVHFLWIGATQRADPAQEGWMSVPGARTPGWLERYVDGQHYWMGYTYGLSLSFAAVAFRSYRERRSRSAARAAVGGVTLSGFLAVAGCFLLGCCGSPMLGVYLSLFGAGFLPFAKPLVAGITTLTIAFFYVWMRRKARREELSGSGACGCAPTSCCASAPVTLVETTVSVPADKDVSCGPGCC